MDDSFLLAILFPDIFTGFDLEWFIEASFECLDVSYGFLQLREGEKES